MGNFYSWLYLSCAGLIFLSGAIVLRHNPRQAVNRKYALLCLSIFLWICAYGISTLLKPYESYSFIVLLLQKIDYTGVIFIPFTFWNYILTFNEQERPTTIKIVFIFSLIITILLWTTPLIINGVYQYAWGVYPKAGSLHPIFLGLFTIVTTLSMFDAFQGIYSTSSSQKTKQSKCLIWAYIILCFCCLDFIPNYGINTYPSGPIFTTLFLIIVGYTVAKHQLMDIKIVLSRSLVYSLLVTSMTVLYFLTIFISERILQHIVGYKTFIGSLFASLILAFTFIPLKNYLQKLVDKIIFGKTPTEIAEENDKLQDELSRREKYTVAAKMAGNIAHEIKNPLTAINTFIQQFPEKKDDPEFVRKFHALASSELERIKQLSYQLMDFAKPADIKLSTFDLHQTLDDVLLLTNERLKKNKIIVNTQFSNEPITLTGDKDQLKQVFLNLILNAADAMENGGNLTVTTNFVGANLCVRPVEGQTHRSAPTDNHNIQIRISDTGCGISQDNLKKLFEPFFTTKKDGTGLGLSICKRIIETHSGKIDVESKINKGTTFLITLPHTQSGGLNA